MDRDHTTYPTEIIPASKLKILLGEKREDFLVVRRTEEGITIEGLKGYLMQRGPKQGWPKPEAN